MLSIRSHQLTRFAAATALAVLSMAASPPPPLGPVAGTRDVRERRRPNQSGWLCVQAGRPRTRREARPW